MVIFIITISSFDPSCQRSQAIVNLIGCHSTSSRSENMDLMSKIMAKSTMALLKALDSIISISGIGG